MKKLFKYIALLLMCLTGIIGIRIMGYENQLIAYLIGLPLSLLITYPAVTTYIKWFDLD